MELISNLLSMISFEQILIVLIMIVEFWLGRTELVEPGSILESILILIKDLLNSLKPQPAQKRKKKKKE